MAGGNYWQRQSGRRLGRRRFVSSALLGGAGLAGIGVAGCSSSNNKKSSANVTASAPAATGAAARATSPAPGASVAPAGTVAATGTRAAGATPAAGVAGPNGPVLAKLSEQDFYRTVPELIPKDFDDKDIKTGGTFNLIFDRETALDFVTTTLGGPVQQVVGAVYSRLIRLDTSASIKSAGDVELEADLGTKWERPDPQSLIVTLANGVKWQGVAPVNGRAFSVDDIKYTFNRVQTYSKSAYQSELKPLQSVEDAGGGTVKLTFSSPYPIAEQLLSSFFMQIVPHELADNPDQIATQAVGTGGMILDKHTPNVEYVYKKNPDFWKKDAQGRQKPYVDGFRMAIVVDKAAQLAQYEGGQVEASYVTTIPFTIDQSYDFIKRNPNFDLQFVPNLAPAFTLVGHVPQDPWKDQRVRQALSLLLDRKTIIAQLNKGAGAVNPFLPWNVMFDKVPTVDQLGPTFQFDPQKAKQLLSAAGLANGLDMDLHWYESGQLGDMCQLFQQTAAQGGVKINLIKSADAAAHAQLQTSKNWTGLLAAARSSIYPDPMGFLAVYLPTSGSNLGQVNDQQIVDLYNKQLSLTGAARNAVFKDAWNYLSDQVFDVMLPLRHAIGIWRPWLKNWRNPSWQTGNVGVLGMGQTDSLWLAPH